MHHIRNAIPTFFVDAPGGGGKIALQPNYILSQSPSKTVLRNFEGVITTYPEPENYVPGKADEYFQRVYGPYESKEEAGITSLFQEQQFNLVPTHLPRYVKRQHYQENPEHASLKDKREKRDELKEKKFQAQQKPTPEKETEE